MSDQWLIVDDELEYDTEMIGCFAAEDHALQENFKVIHDRGVASVDGQLQLNARLIIAYAQKMNK